MTGLLSIRRGYLAWAVLPLERSFEACRRKNLTVWQPIPTSLLGTVFVRLGHVAEGLRLLQDAVRMSRELGIRAHLPAWLVNLAEGHLASGQSEQARAAAEEALEMASKAGERGYEAAAHAVLADICAQAKPIELQSAFAHYEAALRLAEDLGMRPLKAEILLGLSRLALSTDNEAIATKQRAAAELLLREQDMRSWRDQRSAEITELGQLFIVARANTELYDLLTEELSGAQRIKVILDRRQNRQAFRPPGASAERNERRKTLIDEDLQHWGFAVTPLLA